MSHWIHPEDLEKMTDRQHVELKAYDMEPDRSDAQVVLIKKLLKQKGIKDIKKFYPDYKLKTNDKISIGMAKEIINLLLKEK